MDEERRERIAELEQRIRELESALAEIDHRARRVGDRIEREGQADAATEAERTRLEHNRRLNAQELAEARQELSSLRQL